MGRAHRDVPVVAGPLCSTEVCVGRMLPALPIRISAALPTSTEAKNVSARYYEDLVGRYHRRPATREEVLDAEAGDLDATDD